MAKLVARTGLEHLVTAVHPGAGAPGVTLHVRDDLALASVMARRGQFDALVRRAKERLGLDLVDRPRCMTAGGTVFAWSGPGQWLALCNGPDRAGFFGRLERELADVASVVDQSGGRVVIRLSGPRARDVLAKGLPLDLHPRAFRTGDTASSVIAYVGVHLWQADETPTYDIAVFRSYAAALFDWLLDAAAEFGVAIEPH